MKSVRTVVGLVVVPLLALSAHGRAAEEYTLGPDSLPQPGVPQGKVVKYSWTSRVFPGTVRNYRVYVPAQYDAAKATPVMVFQDGASYVDAKGANVPVVFDNLIAKKELPVLIGVFINPGEVPPASANANPRVNRSYEYDGMSDEYARLVLDEILPEVGKTYNLAQDGNSRGIGGGSSGGIAAFTAAWRRPDGFSRVFSTVGSYTDFRGGNDYPSLIRKTEPKPIRVFLQDGSSDLNIFGGSWWVANQDMLSALEFAGYEVNHAWGDGGHGSKQGAAILPDVLRWLWKDYPAPVKAGLAGKGSKQPVMTDLLIPGEGWQLVADGFGFTEGMAVNTKGEVFFTDIPKNRIHKIGLDGKVDLYISDTGGANGLMFGPDGRLYAAQGTARQIVAYDAKGKSAVIADNIDPNDLAVSNKCNIYVTDPKNKQLWLIPSVGKKPCAEFGEKMIVDKGLTFPNGVRLTPDQTQLYVVDTRGRFVYLFTIQPGSVSTPEGVLTNKQPYCYLPGESNLSESGGDGMNFDDKGRLYVATRLGVQFCDQIGRVNGIVPNPGDKWMAHVVLGGAKFDEMFIAASDKVWKRKTKAKGILPFAAPFKPPAPTL